MIPPLIWADLLFLLLITGRVPAQYITDQRLAEAGLPLQFAPGGAVEPASLELPRWFAQYMHSPAGHLSATLWGVGLFLLLALLTVRLLVEARAPRL
ncbi:MAG TPA: hypothetical protein VFA75_17925 [Nevskia sp.]|nr:hypothetical protein [Nevskia sp.]